MKMLLFLQLALSAIVFAATSCTPVSQNAASSKTPKNLHESIKTEKRTPVIVELFTSEGCSSCPPADKVLAALARTPQVEGAEVIALSEHVDYWNRLGWNDPFSSPQFSQRQGEYSGFFGKGDNVYTPQMVVDGTREFVGSNAGAAMNAIAEAIKERKGDVEIKVENISGAAASLNVKVENLPQISKNDNAIVLLAVTEDNLISSVSTGENAGRKLPHVAVVRYLQNVGEITGDKTLTPTVVLPREWKRENLNIVAFVQQSGSRRVIAAGKIKLLS